MVALPHAYQGPKGFVQVSPLGTVSSVIYTDLPGFVRNQPELIPSSQDAGPMHTCVWCRGIWKVVPPILYPFMVTWAIADFAERQKILSPEQAGFRNKKHTTEQLELLVTLLEDAMHSRNDLWLLQVDFSEAFDRIDHDKMLMVMYDLGFPTDAIEAVKDLYTGTNTKVRTPFGDTDSIRIDRGTIQGDSLSPLLFIIYLEPLMRWLQAGARGYAPGPLPRPRPHVLQTGVRRRRKHHFRQHPAPAGASRKTDGV